MTVPQIVTTGLGSADQNRPLLVLGPSLGTSAAALWTRCARGLSTFDVLAWDLPGHGRSPAADGPFTLADLAGGVLAAIDAHLTTRGEPGGSFIWAGDSIGGAVGLQLMLDHPGRISAATLACTGARIGTADGWQERAALVRGDGTAAVVDGSLSRWFAPGFDDPAVVDPLIGSLRATDAHSYAAACAALAAFDVRERLGEIAVPVLAIAGAHDAVTTPDVLREITDGIPGARLVVLDGVAHLAPAESPEIVAALISGTVPDGPGTDGPAPDGPETVGRAAADPYAAGMAVRREVLGAAHVDRATAAITDVTRDFQELITRFAWGSVWTRPGLDRRSRSMITLTALVARGHHEELAMHLRAALTNGLTRAEIAEVLLQSAIYCGVPDANTAFRIATAVFAELDAR